MSIVYFIQEGNEGPIKIGFSNKLVDRLASIQTGNPRELRLLGWLKGNQAKESEIQDKFANYRIRGEWFEPSPELLDFIKNVTVRTTSDLQEKLGKFERKNVHNLNFLWDNWLPRSECSMIVGQPATCKTLFALDVLCHLLNGNLMPDGTLPKRQHNNFIWLDADRNLSLLCHHIKCWLELGILKDEVNLQYIYPLEADDREVLDLTQTKYQNRLIEMVDNLKPEWVIVDSILWSVTRPKELAKTLDFLNRMAAKFEIAVTATYPNMSKKLFDHCRFIIGMEPPKILIHKSNNSSDLSINFKLKTLSNDGVQLIYTP